MIYLPQSHQRHQFQAMNVTLWAGACLFFSNKFLPEFHTYVVRTYVRYLGSTSATNKNAFVLGSQVLCYTYMRLFGTLVWETFSGWPTTFIITNNSITANQITTFECIATCVHDVAVVTGQWAGKVSAFYFRRLMHVQI